MRKMESSKMSECLWALRFEVLGLILLAIATGMTIFSGNGLGIVALFAAGVIFCLFNKGCCYLCSSKQPTCPACDTSHSEEKLVTKQETRDSAAIQAMDNEGGNQTNGER